MSINGLYIFILTIFLINIYIIKYEYKYKKIPNKLLLILLLFNLSYFFVYSANIFLIASIIKLSFLIVLIFILYFFKVWNPSYLKYIFVSLIFFLWNLEITFLSNIFFLIWIYIISYFFYFYWKIIINPKRLKTYLEPLKEKTKWSFHNWVIKNKNNLVLKFITIILWFLSVFILIRVIRYYLQGKISFISTVIEIETITINTYIILFLLLAVMTWILHRLYHKYLLDNYKYLIIIISWTMLFISYEFIYDYAFISAHLHRILTFLLFLFLTIWIILHMWKYLFFDNDSTIIDYKKLKKWDIIDKTLMSNYLIWQKSLENDNIIDYFKTIQNPINIKDCNKLKEIIKKNSDFQEKQWKKLPPNVIRVYNTFNFTSFIFWSFIITLFVWENILISLIIVIFKKIMWLY